jgi:predicted ribosome quality control (RQC) complex YloA/Tae2 family protein
MLFAAKLAAKHCSLSTGSNVPVDYTRRKFVKKPSGSKPGFVIYTHQRTAFVTPE